MLHLGLIGEHLGHSRSPELHQRIWALLGIEADYRLVEIPRHDFNAQAARLFDELDGFNITIPYKQTIMPLLNAIDPHAATIGAVNTVRCGDKTGFNTDAGGFADMLRIGGIDPAGKPCFVLGTGGAAKAIRATLERLGASEVTSVSRHPGADSINYDELTSRFSGILVNCTPAGMWPDTEGCPVEADALRVMLARADGVADVIYNPLKTRLVLAAEAAGIPVIGGMPMLISQAVRAEAIWLDRELPVDDLVKELMKP